VAPSCTGPQSADSPSPAGLKPDELSDTIRLVTDPQAAAEQDCIFCAIVAEQSEASFVYQDATVVAFMDLNPVTPGHLLVVPREHAVGLEDLDGPTSAQVWSVGHQMARALRRSSMRCDGINVLVCDGEVAFQTVFHFHLHVIPRYAEDGWTLKAEAPERKRSLLDSDAQAIKDAIASTD
jgi:diadenosine tetraphosphate (Ap4A) HIT family hydrolase